MRTSLHSYSQFDDLLRESSWLDKMQGITAHLKCWNCWKGEMQSWYRNPSWHRRSILRRIWNLWFSIRVIFSTGANFSVSTQLCWKVAASILPYFVLLHVFLEPWIFWILAPSTHTPEANSANVWGLGLGVSISRFESLASKSAEIVGFPSQAFGGPQVPRQRLETFWSTSLLTQILSSLAWKVLTKGWWWQGVGVSSGFMVASWSSIMGSTGKACDEDHSARRRHSKIKLLGHSFGTHNLYSLCQLNGTRMIVVLPTSTYTEMVLKKKHTSALT